ncbi:hypothetical protein UFOVP603_52 [uncultured Caudovirales phage]|uniref:Uncharacterized protein n=1 Tax=uncultured Caudovirales phage TaxID=2100421 RepID=A0A6J5N0Y2_9CAUD|nr:hypothetical protein UFOVP603_52 [uncultured Caudovirales phage]
MIKKIHLLFNRLDELFELPKGTSKIEVKKHLKIESIGKLEHEDLSYLLRFIDNIFLENNIDIDEHK